MVHGGPAPHRTAARNWYRWRGPRMRSQAIFLTVMMFVSVVFYLMAYGTPATPAVMADVLHYYKNLYEVDGENASGSDWNASRTVVVNGSVTVAAGNATLYLINKPHLCGVSEPVTVLIMVVTAPNNSEARDAIRRTWGTVARRSDVKLAFVLGDPNQESVQRRIVDEDLAYRDLIQGNFLDAYQNLTLKSVLILKWAETYCRGAGYVLKIDDDCFLHPDNLLRLVKEHSAKEPDAMAVFGRVWKKVKPIRDKGNKWFVSADDFPGTEFPEYTGGPTYLLTRRAVSLLYAVVGQVPTLGLEDIYVTGLCAQKANVPRINDNRFGVGDPPRVCASRDVVTYHRVAPDLLYLLWWTINDSKMATCAVKKDAGCEKSKHRLVTDLADLVLSHLH